MDNIVWGRYVHQGRGLPWKAELIHKKVVCIGMDLVQVLKCLVKGC